VGKEIEFKIAYREEGEQKEVKIKIDFISNKIIKDYGVLLNLAEKAQNAYDRISDIGSLIAELEIEKPEGYKEKIKEFEDERVECFNNILDFNDNGYFGQRFDILKRILIDNGYKDNEMLMDLDFWESQVDPQDLIGLMQDSVFKDVDHKKKAVIR
jgi:hypothetical protein